MIPSFVRLLKLNVLKSRIMTDTKRSKVTFRSGALKVTHNIMIETNLQILILF